MLRKHPGNEYTAMYIDLITRMRNAQAVGKEFLRAPYSAMDKAVAELLQEHGFVKKVEIEGRPPKKNLKIVLNAKKPIQGAKWLSRPSLKRYTGYRDLRASKGGYGIIIISTPKGVMTGAQARRDKVGGQVLCEVW